MARRSRRRRRRKGKASPLVVAKRGRFTLHLDSVEITRGHDGFLRGVPEPTLILAAFAIAQDHASLLERELRRLRPTAPFPSTVTVEDRLLFSTELLPGRPRIAVLGVAVEEDRGTDVEMLHAALGQPESLQVWVVGSDLPEPHSIAELAREPATPPAVASSVRLIKGGEDLGDACRADDWIGAALILLAAGQPAPRRWRMPFLSADGRNDWTAWLRIGA